MLDSMTLESRKVVTETTFKGERPKFQIRFDPIGPVTLTLQEEEEQIYCQSS